MRRESRGQHNLVSLLHGAGLKSTVSRLRVLTLLCSEKQPLRIKDIYHKLEKSPPVVDMVTIYRTIEILRDKNLVCRVDFGEDAAYYELTNGEHDHHYITCTKCSKHLNVNFCLFPEFEPLLLKRIPDFPVITQHTVEYFGICKKCETKKSKTH